MLFMPFERNTLVTAGKDNTVRGECVLGMYRTLTKLPSAGESVAIGGAVRTSQSASRASACRVLSSASSRKQLFTGGQCQWHSVARLRACMYCTWWEREDIYSIQTPSAEIGCERVMALGWAPHGRSSAVIDANRSLLIHGTTQWSLYTINFPLNRSTCLINNDGL